MSTFQPLYVHFELVEPYQDKTCFYVLCCFPQGAGNVETHLRGEYAHLIKDQQDGVVLQTVPAEGYTQILWENFVEMADNRLNP